MNHDPLAEKILTQALDYFKVTANEIPDEGFKHQYLQISYIKELLSIKPEII